MKSRCSSYHLMLQYVKGLLLMLLCIKSVSIKAIEVTTLSTGEHKELSFNSSEKFTIGNKDVLSAKAFPKKGHILIKAKKLGFSEVIIMRKGRPLRRHQFYVYSRREYLKKAFLQKVLLEKQMTTYIRGPLLYIEGELKDTESFLYLSAAKKIFQDKLLLNIQWNQSFFQKFLAQQIVISGSTSSLPLNCRAQNLTIICHCRWIEKKKPQHSVIQCSKNLISENYRLELKLLRVTYGQAGSLHPGTQSLSGTMENLLSKDFNSFVNGNAVAFQNNSVEAKVLSNPIIVNSFGKKQVLKFGKEIPYLTSENNSTQTTWKFAGLKIRTHLTGQSPFLLDYEINLTNPVGESISGSENDGSRQISESNSFRLLSSLKMENFQTSSESLPFFDQIPILRHLFQTEVDEYSLTYLVIYAKVKTLYE